MTEAPRSDPGRGSTRREFTASLVLAAAAPLIGGAAPAEAADPPAPPRVEGVAALAQALTEVVRARHGKHLNAEQLAAVERGITRGLATADRLRQFHLDNGDEPAFAFTADVR